MSYVKIFVPMSVVAALAGAAVIASPAVLPQDQDPPEGGAGLEAGEMLIQGLVQTEGCLGVDAGEWMSGKNTIIAWFEDKAAVVRWYDSRPHRGVMAMFSQGADGGYEDGSDPLAYVEDGTGPIMVMATLTPTDGEAAHGMPMPISQISIELFQPLPGGAYIGARLAPETFEVPHMRDLTPSEEGTDAGG